MSAIRKHPHDPEPQAYWDSVAEMLEERDADDQLARHDDELWWPEYKPTEVHCEACGVWLGYNYPAFYCHGCKPESPN